MTKGENLSNPANLPNVEFDHFPDRDPCETSNLKFPKGDIRSFGKLHQKTDDSSPQLNKKRLRQKLEFLRSSRGGETELPMIADKIKAGAVLDILENGQSLSFL